MNPPTQQQIENYLLGLLTEAERKALEAQLEQQPELKEELKIQQLILDQVEAIGDRAMKKKLLAIKAKRKIKGGGSRLRTLFRLGIAAAVVATLVIAYSLLSSPPDPQQLFADHYEAYPLPFASREVGEEEIARLGGLYRQKNYQAALPLIEQLLITNPQDSRLLLARGICQLNLGELKESIKSFNLLINQQDPLYLDQARWYSALAWLKLDQPAESEKILTIIAEDPEAFYHQKAKELLKDLK